MQLNCKIIRQFISVNGEANNWGFHLCCMIRFELSERKISPDQKQMKLRAPDKDILSL